MLQIIDNTFMAFKDLHPSREELYSFCELLFSIGVDVIELPPSIYQRMGELPPGRFILNLEHLEEMKLYPGFYRYVSHQYTELQNVIYELQMNDVREIIKLRALKRLKEVRIVGLDDLICHPYEKYMEELISSLPKSLLNFCPQNTYHCAGALALQWLTDYGSSVTSSFAGCNNNAATEELIMALRLTIRHKPNRNLTVLPQLSELYEKMKGETIKNRKPIIGKNIFKVESGIHVDALHKNPATYEAYSPSCVGARTEIIIGKHSGSRAVKLKLEEFQLTAASEEIINQVLQLVKNICTKHRKSLNEEEFILLVREVMENEGNQAYR
jgi:homocitrate synthase NifV